jgi:hypothetical protein
MSENTENVSLKDVKGSQSFNIEDIYAINTAVVEFPSRGIFYKNKKSQVTIKGYTTIEENMMTDEGLIRSGNLLDKLLESVVMDKDVDWNNILLSDKMAIVMAMRAQNEGNIYKANTVCPMCQTNQVQDIDLSNSSIQELGANPIDGENLFEFVTPAGHTIRFRLLTNADIKSAKEEQNSDEKNGIKMPGGASVYLMLREIVAFKPKDSSEFIESKGVIKQIVQRMPKQELESYRTNFNNIEPKLKSTYWFKCITPNCVANENPMELPIPINQISFFRPIR